MGNSTVIDFILFLGRTQRPFMLCEKNFSLRWEIKGATFNRGSYYHFKEVEPFLSLRRAEGFMYVNSIRCIEYSDKIMKADG